MSNSDTLSGPLADTVAQIRQAPVPETLGSAAMERASGMKASPWTARRIGAISGIAAAICASAFLAGIAMTRWSQPVEESHLAAADSSGTLAAATAHGDPNSPLAAGPAQEITGLRLGNGNAAAGETLDLLPGGAAQNERLIRTLATAPNLPADAQAVMQRYQARVGLLEAQRAQLDGQLSTQRAELVANLNQLRAGYETQGQAAAAQSVQQQIRMLNAVANTDATLTVRRVTAGGPPVTTPVPNGPVVFQAAPLPANAQPPAGPSDTLTAYRQRVGQTVVMSTVGKLDGNIWGGGGGVYTDDSPLGVAAVHAGILKGGESATLKVTLLPGQQSYDAVTKNGITSNAYGPWDGSYRIDGKVDTPRNVQEKTLTLQLGDGTVKPLTVNGGGTLVIDGNNLQFEPAKRAQLEATKTNGGTIVITNQAVETPPAQSVEERIRQRREQQLAQPAQAPAVPATAQPAPAPR
ncbi:MAG TPA: LCCL domain-containing protein [Phycisphaerae bacterium]|nr:LCCL domain-containing protein [Phycisphaerae bacterium]